MDNFNWPGIILDERFPDGREPIVTKWRAECVELVHSDPAQLNLQLPYATTQFELGGNKDAFLFLRHPSLEPAQVYIEVTPEFRDFARSKETLKEKLKKELATHSQQRRRTFFGLSVFIVISVMAFTYRGQIARALTTLIPFSTEKKIADLIYERKKPKVIEQQVTQDRLMNLVEPLLVANPQWREQLTFHLKSDKEPNAYATIGGHIMINRGLVKILKTPEQLLGVIAHEVAHAHKRHVVQSVFQGVGVFLIVQALLGDVTGIVAVLADQGTPLLLLQHSRELEDDADRTAVQTLLQSRIDPRGLPESLQRLHEEAQKQLEGTPMEKAAEYLQKIDIWSTHPEMEARIHKLAKHIETELSDAQTSIRPVDFDYPAFVKMVDEHY